jgi:predicted permease
MTTRGEDLSRRWRSEVRRALPGAQPDEVEEIAQHLADRWMRLRDAGADPDAADRTVFEDLAGWKGRRPPSREPRGRVVLSWVGWGSDARAAIRALRVRPVFTVGSTLLSTIAVTAVVSAGAVVYGILWRPLPYPNAERLAVIWQVRAGEQTQISYPDFKAVAGAPVFDAAAAISGGRGNLRVGEMLHRINVIQLEAPGFTMLGAAPVLGRLLTADDADQPHTMISHRLWRTVFNSDPLLIGRQVWLSGQDLVVVGVLSPGFDFELPVPPSFKREKNDLWTVFTRDTQALSRRDVSGYEAMVRLSPGHSVDDAQVAVDAISRRLAHEFRATNEGRSFRVARLRDEVVAPVRRPLLFVAMAAALTVLVAWVNLAVLGLARASEKRPEFAIRHALGATPFRLWRQFFAENLLVALAGGLCGVVLAFNIVQALMASQAASLPRPDAIRFDRPVWITAATLVLLSALALTWHPFVTRPTAIAAGSRVVGRRQRHSRRLLVAAEIALAIVLATGGAMLTLSLVRLLHVDPGFDGARTGAARVAAYAARYPAKSDVTRFFADVIRRIGDAPGVTAAGAGSSLPLSGQMSGTAVVAEGRPRALGSRPTAGWQVITPGYVNATGLRLIAGRDFTVADQSHEPHVVIVSAGLARLLFGDEDPLGRRIGVGGGDTSGDWHQIIGVVDDVRHMALSRAPEPRVYDLFGPHWSRAMFVAARSRSDDPAFIPATIRMAVRSVDPEAPVFEAATMRELGERSAAPSRLASRLAVGLSLGGVLLALLGVYAVAAAAVSERSREIGVRAALGASRGQLFGLMLGEGVWMAAFGGAVGLIASAIVSRALRSHLFGVATSDAFWVIPAVAGAVLTAMLLAAVPAARRAAQADPLDAMRAE